MTHLRRIVSLTCALLVLTASAARAQSNPSPADNPSPQLVSRLTKQLSITPQQAIGGAGALFGLAKTRLSAEQFGKVSAAVPGMDGLLNAAPQPTAPTSAVAALGSAIPPGAVPGNVTGIASLAGTFKSLGLAPDSATKMIPILTKYVGDRGGPEAASTLAGALK